VAFKGHVKELALNPFGCRVLQKALEHMEVEMRKPLVDELLEHLQALVMDQFGSESKSIRVSIV
jgi:hypothetical protein